MPSPESKQRRDAERSIYEPPVPFPTCDTPAFNEQVTYMFVATKTWLWRIFQYELTMIEQHHYRNIAKELAEYYAFISADINGLGRISHIPREIFLRVRLQEGWTLQEIERLFRMPREDAARELRLQQQLMHRP